jgi:hypothetical protein
MGGRRFIGFGCRRLGGLCLREGQFMGMFTPYIRVSKKGVVI